MSDNNARRFLKADDEIGRGVRKSTENDWQNTFRIQEKCIVCIRSSGSRKIGHWLQELSLKHIIFVDETTTIESLAGNLRARLGNPIDLIIAENLDGWIADSLQKLVHSIDQRGSNASAVPLLTLHNQENHGTAEIRVDTERRLTYSVAMPPDAQGLGVYIDLLLRLKHQQDLACNQQQDIESERAEQQVMEARLKYLVSHDELTGLHNRRQLEQALTTAISENRHHGKVSALLYIDINQFKVINDLEGYDNGDRLIRNVARIISDITGPTDTIARISADDFAVLIYDTSRKQSKHFATTLRKALENHEYYCGSRVYHPAASIGIAMIERADDSVSANAVLARADQACFKAKKSSRSNIHFASDEDDTLISLKNNVMWIPKIRKALLNDDFRLFFQPIKNLRSGNINRYEVLIRMFDNDTIVTPNNFIPVAESTGMIHKIDKWVIRSSFARISEINRTRSDVSLSINLSSHAFSDEGLVPYIRQMADSYGICHRNIVFEITETAAIDNFTQARDLLAMLREMGFLIALDDFGAGFNSFAQLKELPVDILKIDGSFISNIKNDHIDQTLVRAITDIAQQLGKTTVAEFVEDSATYRILEKYNIDYAQGYLIGKPGISMLPE